MVSKHEIKCPNCNEYSRVYIPDECDIVMIASRYDGVEGYNKDNSVVFTCQNCNETVIVLFD